MYIHNSFHTPSPYESIKELGGGPQTSFLLTKTCATATDSPNESNKNDTKACLGFQVLYICSVGPREANILHTVYAQCLIGAVVALQI